MEYSKHELYHMYIVLTRYVIIQESVDLSRGQRQAVLITTACDMSLTSTSTAANRIVQVKTT